MLSGWKLPGVFGVGGYDTTDNIFLSSCLPAKLTPNRPKSYYPMFHFFGAGDTLCRLGSQCTEKLSGGGGRWLSVLSGLFSFKWKHLTSLSYLTIETSLDRSLRLITSAAKGSWVLNWDLENATKSVFLLCNSAKVIQLIKRKIVGLVIRSVKMNYMTLV